MTDKGNDLKQDIQMLTNSADRLKRVINCHVFDALNKRFLKREAKLHLKLTVKFWARMSTGRYW